MRIAVVGTGYVGAVAATCLAWLGHRVVGIDADPTRAAQLGSGQVPFHEEGLDRLLAETLRTGRLRFTEEAEGLAQAELVFLAVGTPPGADGKADLGQLEGVVGDLRRHLGPGATVAVKSTVPVGTGDRLRAALGRPVAANPEFLRQARAVEDFLHPDRIVLGGERPAVSVVRRAYARILDQSFPEGRPDRRPGLFITSLRSAEMTKYAANAFLAVKISFANEVAELCERTGADAREVLPAVGADRRIGSESLSPGVGWGGSCLTKDVPALISTADGRDHPAAILRAAVRVNETRRRWALHRLTEELGTLRGVRVALLGLAFKPHTDDLRGAPAVDLGAALAEAGAEVTAFDPQVKDGHGLPVRRAPDPYEAAAGADAVIVATEWPEFGRVDLRELARRMRGNLVLDGRNALSPEAARAAGLRLVGVGWTG
jgi:UDPglucose 6-dehydrogenase